MNTAQLPFIKAHATENDFVVIVDPADELVLEPEQVAFLCNRRAGIGGDGLLRVTRLDASKGGHWFMDYRNADGSVAEMCGKGIRAFAHVLAAEGLEERDEFEVATRAGLKSIRVLEANGTRARVAVGMGSVEVTGVSTASMGAFRFAGLGVDVGNPHLACVIPGLDGQELHEMAFVQPEFDAEFFPHGVNVEVLTPLSETGEVHMRVWERGVGETRSCGTGTVAAAQSALADAGLEAGRVSVHVPGGTVEVEIAGGSATMTGPSTIVARGFLAEAL